MNPIPLKATDHTVLAIVRSRRIERGVFGARKATVLALMRSTFGRRQNHHQVDDGIERLSSPLVRQNHHQLDEHFEVMGKR